MQEQKRRAEEQKRRRTKVKFGGAEKILLFFVHKRNANGEAPQMPERHLRKRKYKIIIIKFSICCSTLHNL